MLFVYCACCACVYVVFLSCCAWCVCVIRCLCCCLFFLNKPCLFVVFDVFVCRWLFGLWFVVCYVLCLWVCLLFYFENEAWSFVVIVIYFVCACLISCFVFAFCVCIYFACWFVFFVG